MFRFYKQPSDDIPEVALTVSNRTLFRVIIVIIVTLALVSAFLKVTHAVLLLFIALFFTLALNSPVNRIAKALPGKKRDSRAIATTISFLIVVSLLATFAAYIIPPLVNQTEKFISAAPGLISNSQNQHSALGHFIRSHHLRPFVTALSNQISQRVKGVGSTAFSSLTAIAGSIFSILAVLVLTFMMLVEAPKWLKVIREVVIPNKRYADVDRVSSDMYLIIKGYVNGQVLLAAIAAVLIAPALFILHISYPIALMVVVFLAGLVPMIGHTIGAIIVTTVAVFHSISAAIIILLYYIFYMQVENYLLQPRIQANTTNISPLLVFASIIVGVNFGGLFGGLVAIPVTACIKVLLLEYLTDKNLLPKKYMAETSTADKA